MRRSCLRAGGELGRSRVAQDRTGQVSTTIASVTASRWSRYAREEMVAGSTGRPGESSPSGT